MRAVICLLVVQVLEQVSPRPDEVTAKFAARNPDRNRSQEFLPGNDTAVQYILWRPLNYYVPNVTYYYNIPS